MTAEEQRKFIMSLCEQMRTRQIPDLMQLWREAEEGYRRQISQSGFSNCTSARKTGHSLYTY